jgi:hypothetical protein
MVSRFRNKLIRKFFFREHKKVLVSLRRSRGMGYWTWVYQPWWENPLLHSRYDLWKQWAWVYQVVLPSPSYSGPGYWVCGHRVPCHRLTGTFVACNSCHLKSRVANSSEGPFWTNVGQTKYCRDFSCSGPIMVPHVSISPFHVSSSMSICVAIRCNGVTLQWCTVKI